MLTRSETNNAVVVKLENVRPHPNADRLKLATVLGTQVVVGLEAKDGDEMLYFDSNLRLSHDYLHYNNLYSNSEMNRSPSVKGYFGKNGKVRAQRFRGEISNGFIAPLQSLFIASHPHIVTACSVPCWEKLRVGDEFTHINGVMICEKFITSVSSFPQSSKGKHAKICPVDSDMFWKHWDTKQLMREPSRIASDVLYIEEKIHGTSGRTGNVLCRTNRPWWKFWIPKEEWKIVSGTRRVDKIAAHLPVERKEIEQKVAPHLHKGEQIYYEIFGCTKNGGGEIQKGFSYGCSSGKYRVMLYRVTITTLDGFCIDLSREQVYRRAEELGLEAPVLLTRKFWRGNTGDTQFSDFIQELLLYAEGKSALDANTLREGIVVWFTNHEGRWDCLKYKNEEFLIRESKNLDQGGGDVEDIL